MITPISTNELHDCPVDPDYGPAICADCNIRFAKEALAAHAAGIVLAMKVYCWRNGVLLCPNGRGDGGCSLSAFGAEVAAKLRANGSV